ncbi:MAG: hypothetical protein JNM63_08370, partial [Spirochaetia bacterium]|nr:hypothetical protein [Spirochaetia bacterium]
LASPAHSNEWAIYNADLIDENGRHGIASFLTPRIGLQSMTDPDVAEYKILLAKAGGIDAFLLENSLGPAYSNFAAVGRKAGFSILGVISYPREPGIDPEEFQKRIDGYSEDPAWLKMGDRPLFFVWKTKDSLRARIGSTSLAGGVKPVYFYWSLLQGDWTGSEVRFQGFKDIQATFRQGFEYQPWIVPRLRPVGKELSSWDHHATSEDAAAHLEFIKKEMEKEPRFRTVPMACVYPGMDNRPCAAWGRSLAFVPDLDGKTYRSLWQKVLEHRDFFKAVYIATWDDWTETTGIEPTLERGGRDLLITQEAACAFKGIPRPSPKLLELPEPLFILRKKSEMLKKMGMGVQAFDADLDACAKQIAAFQVEPAEGLLASAEKKCTELFSRLPPQKTEKIPLTAGRKAKDLQAFSLDPELKKQIAGKYFEATLSFDFLDRGFEKWKIFGATRRVSPDGLGNFSNIASVVCGDSGTWRSARVRVFPENTDFLTPLENGSDIGVEGSVEIARLELRVSYYPGGK